MLRLILNLILLMSISVNTIYPQSKILQFNCVKLITTTVETVPAGKVWKVESIFTDQASAGSPSKTTTPAILVNGVKNYYIVPTPRGSGLFAYAPAGFPFWLPAGATLAASNKVKYVNVIEFNIVTNP